MLKNNFERPSYYGKDSKLVDIITTELYYNLGLNNLVDGVQKAYTGENRSRNIALTVSFGLSVISNLAGAYYADINHYTNTDIDDTSFKSEILVHAGISGVIFMYSSIFKEKKSIGRSFYDLAKLGAVAGVITFSLYKPSRDYLSDCYMIEGIIPELATPKAQVILFPAYFGVVHYCMMGVNKLEKYLSTKFEGRRKKKGV